jgi:hypothetical protein
MTEVYQTIWAENRYSILARDKQKYEEILELFRNERYIEAFPIMKSVMESEEYDLDDLDHYKEAAQEIWNHFKNKERDNSHFFATLNNQNENLRLLWALNITYAPVYLLNSRIFFKNPVWNKAWVIKNNKMRLFLWEGEKYFRLRLSDELTAKLRKSHTLEEYSKKELDLLDKAIGRIHVDKNVLFNPKIKFALTNGLELE